MADDLTKKRIDALKPGPKDKFAFDGRGFGVKCTPTGAKTFILVYRFPTGRAGKVRRYTIGRYGQLTLAQAAEVAQMKLGDIAKGIDPQAAKEEGREAARDEKAAPKFSVEGVARDFIQRYAKRRNRSWEQKERILDRLVIPGLGGSRPIAGVSRKEITELLDQVEDKNGSAMAEQVLAVLRKLMNWHAVRHANFNSPIVRGMNRYSSKENARDRVLSDDEIRIMWRALDSRPAPFRQATRFLLLTAQRRQETIRVRRDEINAEGVWTIPAEFYKTKVPHFVPLTGAALAQIDELPNMGEIIFTFSGKKPFNNFWAEKAELDKEMCRLIAERDGVDVATVKLKPWVHHDLRRTAKTLMSRAGIRPDISERVLGHRIPGVAAVYDRHAYIAEKRHALNALAAEVQRILEQPASTVVHLASRKVG